jgi:hypothetical protein
MATPAPEPAPAPAADATPPADAPAPAKKKSMIHHKMMPAGGKLAPTKAGDKAVEDLNDASLSAAKSGKPFVAPTTPEAAKKPAHEPMKKMKHMAKKKAPAADTPPADTTK